METAPGKFPTDALQLQAHQIDLTQHLQGVERIARHLVSRRTLEGVSLSGALSLPAIHMGASLWLSRRGHIYEVSAFVRN